MARSLGRIASALAAGAWWPSGQGAPAGTTPGRRGSWGKELACITGNSGGALYVTFGSSNDVSNDLPGRPGPDTNRPHPKLVRLPIRRTICNSATRYD